MALYAGRAGVVYMSTTGTGNAVPVIKLSQWTLEMPTDTIEVTGFGDTNKTYVQGLPDVSGSLSGFWDSTNDVLYQAAASADGCKMYLYPASTASTIYWYGPAWVDFSIDVSVSDAVKISGKYKANGSWGHKS
jgi:hypothetical protein